ncbi:MAG: hypothetical protein KDA60_14310 [Planctomycetales bacterium]|nr:hypothetical protein [Planctomycetales bacterium]
MFFRILTFAFVCVSCMASVASGAIYTDQTAFQTAIDAQQLGLTWSEDFESDPIGLTPNLHLYEVAGGSAEIYSESGEPAIFPNPLFANASTRSWGRLIGDGFGDLLLRGTNNTALGSQALSFEFHHLDSNGPRNDTSNLYFYTSNGVENELVGPDVHWIGWIADDVGEYLIQGGFGGDSAVEAVSGMAIDNIHAYGNVPEPMTFVIWALLGICTGGAYWFRRLR